MDYTKLSDEELAVEAKDNSEALDVLMFRFRYLINVFSRPFYLMGGDSEDVFQEGLIGVFKAVKYYDGLSPFKPFVKKCIKTSILSAVKAYSAEKHKPLYNFVSLSSVSSTNDEDKNTLICDEEVDSPEDSYINKESFFETKSLIKKSLSKFEYKILTLYLEGYSYDDIAVKTNKNIKSIDNAIQRIRKKLGSFKEK